jgi:hypothetical protein
MKAIVQDVYGSSDVIEMKDIEKSVLGDDSGAYAFPRGSDALF